MRLTCRPVLEANRCGMSDKVIWQISTMTALVILGLVALRAMLS